MQEGELSWLAAKRCPRQLVRSLLGPQGCKTCVRPLACPLGLDSALAQTWTDLQELQWVVPAQGWMRISAILFALAFNAHALTLASSSSSAAVQHSSPTAFQLHNDSLWLYGQKLQLYSGR